MIHKQGREPFPEELAYSCLVICLGVFQQAMDLVFRKLTVESEALRESCNFPDIYRSMCVNVCRMKA